MKNFDCFQSTILANPPTLASKAAHGSRKKMSNSQTWLGSRRMMMNFFFGFTEKSQFRYALTLLHSDHGIAFSNEIPGNLRAAESNGATFFTFICTRLKRWFSGANHYLKHFKKYYIHRAQKNVRQSQWFGNAKWYLGNKCTMCTICKRKSKLSLYVIFLKNSLVDLFCTSRLGTCLSAQSTSRAITSDIVLRFCKLEPELQVSNGQKKILVTTTKTIVLNV